jgi:hypothetical protein
MEKIVCMSHPKYDGKDNPDLRCKACCTIFVNRIKELNSKRALDVATWLEGKSTARRKTGSN